MIFMYSKLVKVFEENNGVLTTEMAEEYGFDQLVLKKAAKENVVKEYSDDIFLLDDRYADDLFLLQLKYPESVYSQYTAIMLHWLSTAYPFFYYFSLPKKYNFFSVPEKYIKPHYVNADELNDEYLEKIDSWHSNQVRVTNLEKTVVDSLRNEKLMTFVLEEMIDNYINREDKNIQRLIEYAKRFDVMEIIEKEVLKKL